MHVYIYEKYVIFIYKINYLNINIYIYTYKYFQNIQCMSVYLYISAVKQLITTNHIQNTIFEKHSTHTYIMHI